MRTHRFPVGQTVDFTPGIFDRGARGGRYEIVRHLPAEGAENQYRVKSTTDGQERVVKESNLR